MPYVPHDPPRVNTGFAWVDALAKALGEDPMGGLGPQPLAGTIVNPGHTLSKLLARTAPGLYDRLDRLSPQIEFAGRIPGFIKDTYRAVGLEPPVGYTFPGASSGERALSYLQGAPQPLTIFADQKLAQGMLPNLVAHEGLHALMMALRDDFVLPASKARTILQRSEPLYPPGYIPWLTKSVYRGIGGMPHAALDVLADRLSKETPRVPYFLDREAVRFLRKAGRP